MMDEPVKIGAGADEAEMPAESSPHDIAADPGAVPDPEQEHKSKHSRLNRRVALAAGLIALVAAAIVLPPLINIGRYRGQVAALVSRSLGRPVRISGVELRLLPRPGFVLDNLSVSEDPAFGAEPVLSARTVVASVRILSLWRGRMEIDRVSVDEASLNLVRSAQGRWNLDSLLMSAQPALARNGAHSSGIAGGVSAHFPYLEATDSRVNLKNGVAKSPYSLIDADLSLWQDDPGQWRVRLKGQPVRTDIEIGQADTGELRMEASLRSAAQLREMPLQMQMEWRDAQLGQLSRLLLGSDEGWRGDVTADIDVRGTPENAQTKARLRATGVRREEFTPETPLDFDANCNFRYQHSANALHDIGCDTAIGDGRLHLKAELPGNGGSPEAMLEVKQIPLQAGLDLLRTVRGGFAPGISISGVVDGNVAYHIAAPEQAALKNPRGRARSSRMRKTTAAATATPANLQGTLTVETAQLKGGELKEPLTLPKMTWTPVFVPSFLTAASGNGVGFGTRFTLLLGPVPPAAKAAAAQTGSSPETARPATQPAPKSAPAAPAAQAVPSTQAISVRLGLGARGYDAVVSGTAGIDRIRELAYAFGLPHLDAADGFSGPAAEVDLAARGPWIDNEGPYAGDQVETADTNAPDLTQASASKSKLRASSVHPNRPGLSQPGSSQPGSLTGAPPGISQPSVAGTLTMHRAQWTAPFLYEPVRLTQVTLTVSGAQIAFTSSFAYGAGDDAAKSAPKPATQDAAGETIEGSVQVNASFHCSVGALSQTVPAAGPETCLPQIQLRFGALDAAKMQAALLSAPQPKGIFAPLIDRMRSPDRPKWPEVQMNVQADSLVLAPATLQNPVIRMHFKPNQIEIQSWTAGLLGGSAKGTGNFAWTAGKPDYTLQGSVTGISADALGGLLDAPWTAGILNGKGSLELTGLTAKDLAASASGDLHFDWLRGTLETSPPEARQIKLDDWSGTVKIANGKAQLGDNILLLGKRSSSMTGGITFAAPPKLTIQPAAASVAKPVSGALKPAPAPAK